jgi:hypothetical protein
VAVRCARLSGISLHTNLASTFQGVAVKLVMYCAHVCPAEHEVLPVSEGHRVTLTYNLRALHKTAEVMAARKRRKAAVNLAAVEQTVAAENAADSQDSSSSHTSSSGSGSSTWMTAADVSASAELAAELQAAMADKTWHPEGEALSAVSCLLHPGVYGCSCTAAAARVKVYRVALHTFSCHSCSYVAALSCAHSLPLQLLPLPQDG